MSPNERLLDISGKNHRHPEQVTKEDVSWLLNELERYWRASERLDAKTLLARNLAANIEDQIKAIRRSPGTTVDIVGVLGSIAIQLREIAGPR